MVTGGCVVVTGGSVVVSQSSSEVVVGGWVVSGDVVVSQSSSSSVVVAGGVVVGGGVTITVVDVEVDVVLVVQAVGGLLETQAHRASTWSRAETAAPKPQWPMMQLLAAPLMTSL